MNQRKLTLLAATLCLVLVTGCAKKQSVTTAAPPPPPPAPTASLSANPTSIEKGAEVQLSWQTENATDVLIEGIGAVKPSGTQVVKPSESTTYRLVAKGPGGTQQSTARVTVMEAAPPAQEQQPSESDSQWLASSVKDIYFDYDSHDLRGDQLQTISADAAAINSRPNLKIIIEGHCDERGSTEYNLTLGDERANAVKTALVQAGVNASRLNTISYGKEKPFCTESTEACWQQNRRGHFTLK